MRLVLKIIKIFPPEASHIIALNCLNILYKLRVLNLFFPKFKEDNFEFVGLNFTNKLGTAAGLDKNGDFIDCLGALGFGFIEVGTITPLPQSGNPKPRVFRLSKDSAVINRLGFNNKGVEHLVKNLKEKKYNGVVGVNIGANKNSKDQKRIDDYLICFDRVAEYADYITINISSPNTPELRNLHNEENIRLLIKSIEEKSRFLNYSGPIFLKVSPDEPTSLIKDIAGLIEESHLTGLIISNTTIKKDNLKEDKYKNHEGGLSGKPLMEQSTKSLKIINEAFPQLPIIGVGGVMSKNDFDTKISSGASLVQIYTGFIIHGPQILKQILTKY
ncbi:quinone-dependent dihydroorotate dehydrogenase [Gammaproteobacteria bacterium]|nr:quinone-dependent dihydroorotate dehydrogenase [Gammaproteobacteria bacterium]